MIQHWIFCLRSVLSNPDWCCDHNRGFNIILLHNMKEGRLFIWAGYVCRDNFPFMSTTEGKCWTHGKSQDKINTELQVFGLVSEERLLSMGILQKSMEEDLKPWKRTAQARLYCCFILKDQMRPGWKTILGKNSWISLKYLLL